MEDLQLMLDNVTAPVQVKAAGGIRDCDSLLKVWEMGVTRVGSSRTVEMLGEVRNRLGLPAISPIASAPAPSSY
jgi:deoxyribose-phosphate aldolase